MKFDNVTQWVIAYGESHIPLCRACSDAGENGPCGSHNAGLAPASCGMSCESPIRLKLSQQAGREVHGQDRQRKSEAGRNEGAGRVLSPEKCIVVVREDNLAMREKVDGVH